MVKGKPHSDFAGYVAERRNIYSGGHTVILDCRLAAAQEHRLSRRRTCSRRGAPR
jgi:hypothetical protein